ncbi:hypothetical protein BJ085DRAFT_21283, partial [Dimargaris cristalligena]
DIICFGIGSLWSSKDSQLQMALLRHLETLAKIQGSVSAFDPVFTNIEKAAIKSYGYSVITENNVRVFRFSVQLGGIKRPTNRLTLFYMPHCEGFMYHNLLEANLVDDKWEHVAFIGNNLQRYIDRYS